MPFAAPESVIKGAAIKRIKTINNADLKTLFLKFITDFLNLIYNTGICLFINSYEKCI